MSLVSEVIEENIQIKKKLLQDTELQEKILKASKLIIDGFNRGNKVLLCGNGGSAGFEWSGWY